MLHTTRSLNTAAMLLSLTCASWPLPLVSQNTCAILLDATDEFVGVRELEVGASGYSKGPLFTWRADGERWHLLVRWRAALPYCAVVLEQDPLLLKLENGNIVNLRSDSTVSACAGTGANSTFSYAVDQQILELLSSTWVGKLRIVFTAGQEQYDAAADPAWQYALASSAQCFLEALTHARAEGAQVLDGSTGR